MRQWHHSLIAAALVVPLLAPPASAWRAYNGHEVFALSDGSIEVLSRPGAGATDFWCAIGDYAVRQARAASSQRLYLLHPIAQSVSKPRYKSIRFGYEKPSNAQEGNEYVLSMRRVGENISVGMARQYCFGNQWDDRWFP